MKVDLENPGRYDRTADGRSASRKPALITFAVVALLLAALAVFQLMIKPAMIKGFLSKMVPPAPTISTELARADSWVPKLPSVGSLTAIQGIDVTAQIAGVVSVISFESGQDVSAGAKLVTLDSAVEQADLASNRATLQQTELDLKRQNDLSKKAYASEATQQAAQAKRDSAAASVQRTGALVTQKTIVAPFAGRLGIRKVELGQYIAPGTAMVTLQALDPIRVDFPVPEQELSKLKVGQSVEVSVDTFPGEVFTGVIQFLDARVNLDTRTLLVRANLKNPDKKLLPGMFANISVLQDAATPRVTIPRTAITYSLFGDSVYVVKPAPPPETTAPPSPPPAATGAATPATADLIAERRFVRVGDTREDRVAIVEGVAVGEQVVTSGQLKLQNGARVKVDNASPMSPASVRPKQ
jgi:membrane fusion protein, multidrug efflux system